MCPDQASWWPQRSWCAPGSFVVGLSSAARLAFTSHILTSYFLLLGGTLVPMSSHKMDTERVHLPFPTPASEGAPMVAKNEKSWTTPPTTPVGLSKPQPVFSTPDTNHTSNSITGILEDILPRMKAELQDCHMLDLPFDDFLRRFVTLEDANCELSFLHVFFKYTFPSF